MGQLNLVHVPIKGYIIDPDVYSLYGPVKLGISLSTVEKLSTQMH